MIRHDKEPVLSSEIDRDCATSNSRDMHKDQRPLHDNTTNIANGEVEQEGQYGPWMVVAKKRYRSKGTNKVPSMVGLSKSAWGALPH